MAVTPVIVFLFIFLVGLSIGAGVTAWVVSSRRENINIIESSSEPPRLRDPANPYEPSTIISRKANRPNGCGLVVAVSLIVGISLIAFAATYFVASTTTIKTAPVPPPTVAPPVVPPPVVPPPVVVPPQTLSPPN